MIDAKGISVIATTVTLGPPHAAPIAMKVLESNLSDALLYLAIGHLGSALVLFLLFQAIKPLIERVRATFAYLWIKLRRGTPEASSSLPFEIFSPGRKYFFLGAVAFVFAFGSFLGVGATQAVGMRRSRAFLAVMIGCGLSVIFWGLGAFYLSKMVDPMWVTLIFVIVATAFMARGKMMQNRVVIELMDLGADGLRVLHLVAQNLKPMSIAKATQLKLEETHRILQSLSSSGYIAKAGTELYEATADGIAKLAVLPESVQSLLTEGFGRENAE